MKKTLLKERFQQLAGIKPLYEQKSGTDNAYSTILDLMKNFGDLLGTAEDLLKTHEQGKNPSEYDKMIGGDVESHPAWPTLKDKLQGKELYMFFLFVSAGFQNYQAELPFGEDGDVERVVNYYLDKIAVEDFDADELASNFTREVNVRELGSGDIKQDRDIILQLMTIGNSMMTSDIPLSDKEMYDVLKSGTLNSASYKVSTSQSEE